MKCISATIANALWNQGIIQKDDIEACQYGLAIFLSSVIEIASILIISVFVGNFSETVLFFTAFIPLRIYAGGYHADTRIRCYLISLAVYGIFTLVMNVFPKNIYAILIVLCTICSLIVVLVKAPVIHKNKSVSEFEVKHYRKFSIMVCSIETAVILLLTAVFPDSPYVVSLAIGQAAVVLSMIMAVIKEKLGVKKY